MLCHCYGSTMIIHELDLRPTIFAGADLGIATPTSHHSSDIASKVVMIHSNACKVVMIHSNACKVVMIHSNACKVVMIHSNACKVVMIHSNACKVVMIHSNACKVVMIHSNACKVVMIHSNACKVVMIHSNACKVVMIHSNACPDNIPSGNSGYSYGNHDPFIMMLPMLPLKMGISHSYVSLPEGTVPFFLVTIKALGASPVGQSPAKARLSKAGRDATASGTSCVTTCQGHTSWIFMGALVIPTYHVQDGAPKIAQLP